MPIFIFRGFILPENILFLLYLGGAFVFLPAVLYKKILCLVCGLSALPLSLHSPQAGNAFGGAPIPAALGDAKGKYD
ncbi:MAG: hypothetical protein J6X67_07040 [Treponema sp.]|nr:hypothetical protein [Treponema sp.]